VLFDVSKEANTKFVEAKAQYKSGEVREEKLKNLATAYDSFVELKSNLEEGTKVLLLCIVIIFCYLFPLVFLLFSNHCYTFIVSFVII